MSARERSPPALLASSDFPSRELASSEHHDHPSPSIIRSPPLSIPPLTVAIPDPSPAQATKKLPMPASLHPALQPKNSPMHTSVPRHSHQEVPLLPPRLAPRASRKDRFRRGGSLFPRGLLGACRICRCSELHWRGYSGELYWVIRGWRLEQANHHPGALVQKRKASGAAGVSLLTKAIRWLLLTASPPASITALSNPSRIHRF